MRRKVYITVIALVLTAIFIFSAIPKKDACIDESAEPRCVLLWMERHLARLDADREIKTALDFMAPDYVRHLLAVFYTDIGRDDKTRYYLAATKKVRPDTKTLRPYNGMLVNHILRGENDEAITLIKDFEKIAKEIANIQPNGPNKEKEVKENLCAYAQRYLAALGDRETLERVHALEECQNDSSRRLYEGYYTALLMNNRDYSEAIRFLINSAMASPQDSSSNPSYWAEILDGCLSKMKQRDHGRYTDALGALNQFIAAGGISSKNDSVEHIRTIIKKYNEPSSEISQNLPEQKTAEPDKEPLDTPKRFADCAPRSRFTLKPPRSWLHAYNCIENIDQKIYTHIEWDTQAELDKIQRNFREPDARAFIRWVILMDNSRRLIPPAVLEELHLGGEKPTSCPMNDLANLPQDSEPEN